MYRSQSTIIDRHGPVDIDINSIENSSHRKLSDPIFYTVNKGECKWSRPLSVDLGENLDNLKVDETEEKFSFLPNGYCVNGGYDYKMRENFTNASIFKKEKSKIHKQRSCLARPRSYDDTLNKLAMMETSLSSQKRKTFCQQMRIFCQRSTLHGLSDLCRAENWGLRIFWIATFLLAVGAAFYGCYHIMEQYLESPVVVSYFVQESDLKFALPDLVICPFNRFNGEFLKNYSIENEVAQHMQLVFGMSAKHPAQRRELYRYMTPESMAKWDSAMNMTLDRLNMTFDEFLEAASLKCKDVFVDCAFPGGPADCCDDVTGVVTFAGKCYRIRGVNQSGPGFGYGMTIVVSLPKQLYSLAVNNWLNDGILVKLAEPGQGIDYDMTFIPVGTHALMPLKATKYEFMDDPPRFVCSNEESVNYSRVDCFDHCFLEAAQNNCRCAAVGNRNIHKWPLCTTSQYYNCLLRYLIKQFEANKDAEHYFFECRQRCKPRCTYWQYQSAVSYSKFPSDEARAFARSNEEWTRMKNTIILDLYYEKLEFTRIKHYRAMTIHGFIANLGGQYSLWLGGSILTLMQLLVFFVNYATGGCKRFLANRRHGLFSMGAVANRDFIYDSHSVRDRNDEIWRKRSKSGGGKNGRRRHSTTSGDYHPQLQALTYSHWWPGESNGTCCVTNTNESTNRCPAECSSLTDIRKVKKRHVNGAYHNRSPSADHLAAATTGHRSQWESSYWDPSEPGQLNTDT